MKISYLLVTSCFLCLATISQVLQAQGVNIKSGSYVRVSGMANIRIDNGNLAINGTYSKGSENVFLSGSSASTITGTGSADLHSLLIHNTGGITHRHSLLNADFLTIYTGSKFTIDTTSAINVNTMVRNKATASELVIKSNPNAANGSLIFRNPQDSAVQATVEMYSKASKPSTAYKWQFFGIPVRSLAASPTFDGSYVRKMNEAGWYSGTGADKHWIQLSSSSILTPFTGYEITQITPKTITFKGDLVNSNYASGQLAITTTAQYPGQHLIGNPYTAAIDISKIEFGSTDVGIIENTVYLYNTGSLAEWTDTGAGKTSGNNAGQHIAIPQNQAGQGGLPAQIPSMQAFLVAAVSNNPLATVSIPYSAVGTIVKNTDKQRAKTLKRPCTIINISGSRFTDKVWLFTNENCTKRFDNGWDGYKFAGSTLAPQLYAKETSGDFQVNTVDNIDGTTLGLIPGEDNQYTMTFTHENAEQAYTSLYLVDLLNNTTTDITANGSTYTFSTTTGDPEARFKIVTNPGTITGDLSLKNENIRIFNNKNTIFINHPTQENGWLTIINSAGSVVGKTEVPSGRFKAIPTSLPPGSYIVQFKSSTKQATAKLTF